MELHQDDVLRLFLALGLLLAAARAGGAVARRLGQPGVLGEIAAGVLLGPTVLGRAAPEAQAFLFPQEGPAATAFGALSVLAVNLFLMASGMELSVSSALRRGREMLAVALGGIAAPFALGWIAGGWVASLAPSQAGVDPTVARLFLATALSISALPVIARTLMDLRLDRTDFGVTVIGAAVLNDLFGWLCFAGVLAHVAGDAASGPGTGGRVLWTLAFTVGMLALARPVIHRVLPLVLARC